MLGVLDGVLKDREWLVGDEMTLADMAFVPWNDRLGDLIVQPLDETYAGLPHVRAWHERMAACPAWKKACPIRAGLMKEQGLFDFNGMPEGFTNIQEYLAAIEAGDTTRKAD